MTSRRSHRATRRAALGFLGAVAALLAGCADGPPPTHPPELARHRIGRANPASHGLLLKSDGKGHMDGMDPRVSGPYLEWQVRGDKFMFRVYGEEGEHGDFDPYSYEIRGDRLRIWPAIMDEVEYRAKP